MDEKSKKTQKFLRSISRRLSGRSDCTRVEFLVGIGYPLDDSKVLLDGTDSESDYIYVVPDIQVYRDLHHRSDKDLFRISDFICYKYFPEIVIDRNKYGYLKVDTSQLVKGVFKYQLSFYGTRRRWIKMFSV